MLYAINIVFPTSKEEIPFVTLHKVCQIVEEVYNATLKYNSWFLQYPNAYLRFQQIRDRI